MAELLDFRIIETNDKKINFIGKEITITVGNFSLNNGKHQIAEPYSARAQFVCSGDRYSVDNTDGIPTVEDWYQRELLPKYQMMNLLLTA